MRRIAYAALVTMSVALAAVAAVPDAPKTSVQRFVEANLDTAKGYWPLDDPPASLRGRALVGNHPMQIRRIVVTDSEEQAVINIAPVWGTGHLAPWFAPSAVFRTFRYNTGETTTVQARPEIYSLVEVGDVTEWAIDVAFRGDPTSSSLSISASNRDQSYFIAFASFTPDLLSVAAIDFVSGIPLENYGTYDIAPAFGDDQLHHIRIHATESSGLLVWTWYLDGVALATDTSASLGMPDLEVVTISGPGGPEGFAAVIGQVIVWGGSSIPSVDDVYDAMRGHAGEQAHERFNRVLTQDGVTGSTDATSSSQVGPQPYADLFTILRQLEAADQGVLYDGLDGGLIFQATSERYNLATDLALDYDEGHIKQPFAPADDDQGTVNDVEVQAVDGSVAQAIDQDSIDKQGRYRQGLTLNVPGQEAAANAASWRIHLGTVDEYRYAVNLQFHSSTDLLDEWLACDIGSRITIDNLPDGMPPDQVDQILEGYTERINSLEWHASLNLQPYSPYYVFQLNHPIFGRLDTSGSSLALGVGDDDTSLLVATDSGKAVWITTADRPQDFPFCVQFGGEVVQVTDISGSVSPQTFTVVRGVNGVVKSHAAGTRVALSRLPVLP